MTIPTIVTRTQVFNMPSLYDDVPAENGFVYTINGDNVNAECFEENPHIREIPENERRDMGGKYHLHIERSEIVSDDIEQLERILMEWAACAGFFDDDDEIHLDVAKEFAAHCGDIDKAMESIQTALDVQTGDIAGIFFSDVRDGHPHNPDHWPNMSAGERKPIIEEYVEFEQSMNCNHTDTGRGVCADCGTPL